MVAPFSLAIEPKKAIAKFVVDMRLYADRAWRSWNGALSEALESCGLSTERRMMLDLQPTADFFYGSMVALHAYRIRDLFEPHVSEALLRELARQVDGAVGRSDSAVSTLIFIVFGELRRARHAEDFCDRDHIVGKLLERIGLHKNPRTSRIMTNVALRQELAAPLALAGPNWWEAFLGIYMVCLPVLAERPRPRHLPRRAVDERVTAPARASLHAGIDRSFSLTAWLDSKYSGPGDQI